MKCSEARESFGQARVRKNAGESLWQTLVAAVAERQVLRMFATAPRDGLVFGKFHLLRREGRAFVRTVAERLALGLAAGAEIICASLHRQHERGFLGDDRFTHLSFVCADGG